MKFWIFVVGIGALLIVSGVVLASHTEYEYGLGNVSFSDPEVDHYATGYATGDDGCGWGYGYGEGAASINPPSAGWYEPTIHIDIETDAWLALSYYFTPDYAEGVGSGSGSGPGVYGSLDAYSYVDSTQFQGKYLLEDPDSPPAVFDYGPYSYYDASETISVSHTAFASAGVINDSDDIAGSSADVYANGYWQ